MNFVALCKNEFRVYNTASPASPVTVLPSGAVSAEGYSSAVSTTALITPEGDVALYDGDFVQLSTLPRRQGVARAVKLSPQGSFVVVFERFNAKQPADNVFLYSLANAAAPTLSTSFTKKSISDRHCILWTSDERFALRLLSGSIEVFPGRNVSGSPLFQLSAGSTGSTPAANLAQMALAPNDRFVVAMATEQAQQQQPARVLLFDLQQKTSFHSKTLPFGVDAGAGVSLAWSRSGLGLLVTATTATGSGNYYGTTSLHLLRIADAPAPAASASASACASVVVDERIANSAQTSVWAESGADEFLALTGDFPCEVGLFDGRTGKMKTSFGKYRRNTLVFQGFSRYFLLLGLGNLPGDFELFDKNKGLVLSSGRLPCPVQVLFAPDGRTWLAATTSPRMRVDNGFSLFNYDATSLAPRVAINDLYHVEFLSAASPFPDVPPSPRLVAAARAPATAAAPAGAGAAAAVVGMAPDPATAGTGAPRFGRGGAFAEALRRAKLEEESAEVKKLPAAGVKEVATVPGLGLSSSAALSTSKSRNERRRVAKAKAAFGGEADAVWEKPKGEVVRQANAAVPVLAKQQRQDEEEASSEEEKELDPKKKLRNLNKKLKEVERLEAKAHEEDLNEAQKLKIANKHKLLAEIAKLNL